MQFATMKCYKDKNKIKGINTDIYIILHTWLAGILHTKNHFISKLSLWTNTWMHNSVHQILQLLTVSPILYHLISNKLQQNTSLEYEFHLIWSLNVGTLFEDLLNFYLLPHL
jgi:hypothetical protein